MVIFGQLAKACKRRVDLQINFLIMTIYIEMIAIKGDYKLSFGFSKTDIRINDVIFDCPYKQIFLKMNSENILILNI